MKVCHLQFNSIHAVKLWFICVIRTQSERTTPCLGRWADLAMAPKEQLWVWCFAQEHISCDLSPLGIDTWLLCNFHKLSSLFPRTWRPPVCYVYNCSYWGQDLQGDHMKNSRKYLHQSSYLTTNLPIYLHTYLPI